MKYELKKYDKKTPEERGCDYLQTWSVALFNDCVKDGIKPYYSFREAMVHGKRMWMSSKGIKVPGVTEEPEVLFKRLEKEGFQIVQTEMDRDKGNKYIYFDIEGWEDGNN